jgi:protein-arginine kinase activator protein McsA
MFLKNLKNRSVTGLFNEFFNEAVNYDYTPTNYVGKTTTETGTDKEGYTWYKTTFASNDGSYTQTSFYKTKDGGKMPNFFNTENTWFNEAIKEYNTTNEFKTQRKDIKSTEAGKAHTDRLNILKSELDVVIKEQKFEEAVRLRDEINSSEKNNLELTTLKAELETLVKTHNFEKAIEVRDKINEIEGK